MPSSAHEARQTPPQPVQIECIGLGEAAAVLPQLQDLFDGAYHDSHMSSDLAEDIEAKPEGFQLFVARTDDQLDTVVGAAVVESKIHPAFNYLDFPPVHVKRFTVSEAIRGMGIGKQLLDETKRYGFEEQGLKALFVESNEIGAISMYGREGALYSLDSIQEYWRRNTPEQALAYFAMDITDPRRRGERYPNGEGIRFVFARDEATTQFFQEHGHISKEEVLRRTGITPLVEGH
jgi:ribosomal protein S18 acetylase RimI-like enzyme